MTDWKARMQEILDGFDILVGEGEAQEKALALVNERLDAEGLRNKVWMVMPYQCERCALVHWYECEVGVEGPDSWRADLTFLASPFTAGRCPRDSQPMTHRMHKDVIFDGPVDPGTPFASPFTATATRAQRYFRVTREPWPYTTQGCDDDGNVIKGLSCQPFLSTPVHAINRQMVERTHTLSTADMPAHSERIDNSEPFA